MPLDRSRVATRVDLDPRVEAGNFLRLDDIAAQTFSTFPLVNIGRRNPNAAQLVAANILGDEETAVFCVWDFELGFAPKTHDRIYDAQGVTWEVRGVEHKIMNTRYHCVCVRLYNP